MRIMILCAITCAMSAASASAQNGNAVVRHTPEGYLVQTTSRFGTATTKLGSAPQILRDFADPPGAGPGDQQAAAIAAYRDRFPAATVDSVVDGLEQIARRHRDDMVANRALTMLGLLGRNPDPRRSYTARLARIYRAVGRERKLGVVSAAGKLAERGPASAFLGSIAAERPTPANEQLPEAAVFSLTLLGEEGANTLRDLHTRRAVTDLEARVMLDGLAKQNFRVEPRP